MCVHYRGHENMPNRGLGGHFRPHILTDSIEGRYRLTTAPGMTLHPRELGHRWLWSAEMVKNIYSTKFRIG